MLKFLVVAATAASALSATAASAQDGEERVRRVRVGPGLQVTPRYPGSDQVQLGPFGDLSIARPGRDFVFEAQDESFGFSLLGRTGLGIGPALALQGSRRDRDVGAPVGRVDTTFEAGAFVQYMFDDRFRVRVEGRKGLGGHDAVVGDVSADVIWRDGDRYVFSLGPRVSVANRRYQRAYFGVDAAQSARTGLPIFRPNGGIQSVGATAGLVYQFSDRWGAYGYARYDRMIDDAGRSPIVRSFGSRDQFSGGLALTYTFNVRLPKLSSK